MDGKRNTLLLTAIAGTLAALAGYVYAQPGNEAYFSPEIDDAVAHAKRNPVDDRYVGSSWYNRSTSRSFPLPKLLNTEMDQQVIEGAVGATAAGDQRAAVVAAPVREASLGRKSKSEELNENSADQEENNSGDTVEQSETEVYIKEIKYSDSGFTGAARNIRSNVSISARVRD